MASASQLDCSICRNPFVDNNDPRERVPITLHCGHTYCVFCINGASKVNKIECFDCGRTTEKIDALLSSSFMRSPVRQAPPKERGSIEPFARTLFTKVNKRSDEIGTCTIVADKESSPIATFQFGMENNRDKQEYIAMINVSDPSCLMDLKKHLEDKLTLILKRVGAKGLWLSTENFEDFKKYIGFLKDNNDFADGIQDLIEQFLASMPEYLDSENTGMGHPWDSRIEFLIKELRR